jgi:hypothetical protein
MLGAGVVAWVGADVLLSSVQAVGLPVSLIMRPVILLDSTA